MHCSTRHVPDVHPTSVVSRIFTFFSSYLISCIITRGQLSLQTQF